jgi:rRNA maturation RNase YbeY
VILQWVDRRTGPEVAQFDSFDEGFRKDLLAGLAEPLGQSGWAVDVVLVDDEAMAGLNEDFRKTPGVTDVLSFSYLRDAGSGQPELVGGQGGAFTNLWLDTFPLAPENDTTGAVGEVVLAPMFVTERCRLKGWPLEHEIPLLVVHGILHILGWDHESEAETVAMQAAEEEILSAGGLPHPLRERS